MSKHTTLDQLKMLAQRTKGEIDKVDSKVATLSGRVDTLEARAARPTSWRRQGQRHRPENR